MKEIYLKELLKEIDGELMDNSSDILITNIVNNPRKIIKDSVYFHLYKTKYIDLELFKKRGQYIAITDTPEIFANLGRDITIVKVEDIGTAYWRFIDYYRGIFNIPIVGITGTCGKTTTKDMTRHILLSKYENVHSTFRSDNATILNHYYLMTLSDKTDAAVFEMGVSEPGNLSLSCRYFKPNIRAILNIDVYHLTGCRTPENYLKAKAEILEDIDNDNGTLILNADDENIEKLDVSKIKNVVYFGTNGKADFQIRDITYGIKGMIFKLRYKNKDYSAYIPGYGKHNVYNAVAAIAMSAAAKVSVVDAIKALKHFKYAEEHLERHTGMGGCVVLDDTWNNSPMSMNAAIEVLKNISGSRKTVAVLGEMPRLGQGKHASEQYAKIGENIISNGIENLIIVGKEVREIGEKAIDLGMNAEKVYFVESGQELGNILQQFLNKDTIILLKIPHRIMIEPEFIDLKNKLLSK